MPTADFHSTWPRLGGHTSITKAGVEAGLPVWQQFAPLREARNLGGL